MSVCNERMPYIFISYAHRDSERVFPILMTMRRECYNIWYDEGINPGTEWDENIATHITNCSFFVAFVSEAYMQSENCKDELNYARDLDKELLIIYLDNVELPAGMAMRLNRLQAVNWYGYDQSIIAEAYQKLYLTEGLSVAKLTPDQLPQAAPSMSFSSHVPSPHVSGRPVTTQNNVPLQTDKPSALGMVLSIIALCCGLFSLLGICFGGAFLTPIGLIVGIVPLFDRRNRFKPLAVIGICFCVLSIIVTAAFLIWFAIDSAGA